jgi:acyl-CoA thioesterase
VATSGLRETLSIETVDKEDGEAVATMDAGERHLNDGGIVHGGAIATLADCAMGSAVCTTLDDEVPLTVEMKINYLEPAKEGTLVATARVRRRGKRFIVVEAEVVQEDSGESVAYSTATFTTTS